MASPPFLPVSPPHFFSFSPSSTRRRIRFVRDASRFFSMEAAVCLPCGVSQSWSGLESWQWCRRCSCSGRALGALCPVRASKAVVASLSFALHHLSTGPIGDRSPSSQCCSSAKASHAASIRLYRLKAGLPSAASAICMQLAAFYTEVGPNPCGSGIGSIEVSCSKVFR